MENVALVEPPRKAVSRAPLYRLFNQFSISVLSPPVGNVAWAPQN